MTEAIALIGSDKVMSALYLTGVIVCTLKVF